MAGQDMAFEVFVRRAIEQLKADVKGWSEKSRALRAACTNFLEELAQVEGQMQVVAPLPKEVIAMVMKPLALGCSSEQPSVEEGSLAVLHKLVAHAWLQGETSVRGSLADDANIVVAVSKLVVKCADSMSSAVHLSVIRALLTITTSEHFVPHGECLVHCIRTVFNLAIASEDGDIKRTACNALFQMLNTIVKRIAQVNSVALMRKTPRGDLPSSQRSSDAAAAMAEEAADPAPRPPFPDVGVAAHGPPANARSSSAGSTGAFSADGANRTAHLVALAEQRDLRGLEAALGSMPPPGAAPLDAQASAPGAAPLGSSSAGASAPASGAGGVRDDGEDVALLDVLEADMVFVMHALCKLAAREANLGALDIDAYVLAGKHLALELLVKVMEMQSHPWSCIRPRTWAMLQQPLCLVLLRSSSVADEVSFPYAPRLFVALLMRPPLRSALKAEMCAFFPLLLLRPMESENVAPASLLAALLAAAKLCGDAQLLVDIFVNYDCDLQATNAFERMVSGLRRVVAKASAIQGSPEQRDHVTEAAITCICAALRSLEAWVQARRGDFLPAPSAAEDAPGEGADSAVADASRFEVIKAMKDTRAAGVILFETSPLKGVRHLQKGGVVGEAPAAVAAWLRANVTQLSRDSIGELFGMDNEFCIATMHAWVDQEDYSGMAFDAALRRLLREFKLPGEAQQIDRIMEKFAEAYCRCNPGVFAIADDAYRLAFAVIMLNTDAHNPMAEHMLSLATFIEMNTQASDDDGARPALPQEELEAIFNRIQSNEIKLVGSSTSKDEGSKPRQNKVVANPLRLAAALGLASTFMPFRGSGSAVTGNASEPVANRARPPVAHAVTTAHWHTARTVDHVRHMLQVAGPSVLEVLKLGLQQQSLSDKMYSALLDAVRVAVRLTGLMGLYSQCEDIMTSLCDATGVYHPEPLGSQQAGRQLQALQMLLKIGNGPEGALITTSWWLLLRCISTLEALQCAIQEQHIAVLDAAARTPPGASEGAASGAPVVLANVEAGVKSVLNGVQNFFSELGGSHGARPTQLASSALFSSGASGRERERRGPDASAGAHLVQWAFEGEGAAAIDAVYERSANLDGEGIIMFMRALCAVSQQELQPAGGVAPRVWSLQRLVECSFHNVGRIRLVWARIWALVSPHMVAAACHEDPGVAMTAVDALKQLVAQLLQRSELMFFNWQQDALAPFVAILRHSGSVMVREMAVQCLKNTLQSNPASLGSGWAGVLQALEIAVSDAKLALVSEGIATLRLAVAAAAQCGVLLEHLPRLAAVCTLAALNPVQNHLCFDAMKCLAQCADLLAAARVGVVEESSSSGGDLRARAPSLGARPASSGSFFTSADAPSSLNRLDSGRLEDADFAWARTSDLWALLLHAAAHVALHALHDTVSEQGAEEAVHILQKHSAELSPATLQTAFDCLLLDLFDCSTLPPQRAPSPPPRAAGVLQVAPPVAASASDPLTRLLARLRTYLPSLVTILVTQYATLGPDRLRAWLKTLVRIIELPDLDAVTVGVSALQQAAAAVGQAADLDSSGWQVLVEALTLASSTGVGREASQAPEGPEAAVLALRPPARLAVPDLRALATCSMQHSITSVLEQCGSSMPPAVQLQLLVVLHASVDRAAAFNRDAAARAAAAASFRAAAAAPPDELDVASLPSASRSANGRAFASGTANDAGSPSGDPASSRDAGAASGSGAGPGDSRARGVCAASWTIKLGTQGRGAALPALVRQEVEGGLLLINAYLRTIRTFRESASRHPSLIEAADCAATAERHLLYICRKTIAACVDECTEDAMSHSDWVAAVHAPLLCHALRAFCDLHSDDLVKELKLMLPSLCKLMRSEQVMVRCALADMLDRALTSILIPV